MNALSVGIDAAWLALAVYGLRVQWLALSFARLNWRVARLLPLTHVLVMAHARLRSNAARLSVIGVNALIGVVALTLAIVGLPVPHQPAWVVVINTLIAIGFTGNEIVMVVIARLEVVAHKQLVRRDLS